MNQETELLLEKENISQEQLKQDSNLFQTIRNNLRRHLRWFVLFLNCTLLLGNYYAYDNPSALSPLLRQYLKPLTEQNQTSYETIFSLTYSVYSFPNLILPSITGLLIQTTRAPAAILLILSSLTLIGHFCFLLGVRYLSVPLMLIGRFIFGVGGESVSVVQSFISALWFADKELGLAMGFSLAIPRVGSVLNASLSPLIATYFNGVDGQGVIWAIGAGLAMCGLSFIAALVLIFIIGIYPPGHQNAQNVDIQPDKPQSDLPLNQRPSLMKTLKNFPISFWFLCVIVFCIYGTIIPFNNVFMDLMLTKFVPLDVNNRQAVAGTLMSIPDTICAVLVPLSGFIVDKFGRRGSMLLICCSLIGLVHLTLGLIEPTTSAGAIGSSVIIPIIPLIVLGVSYSFYGVAFWSAIACLFTSHEDHHLEINTPMLAQQQIPQEIQDDQDIGRQQSFYDSDNQNSPLIEQHAFTFSPSSSQSPLLKQLTLKKFQRYQTMQSPQSHVSIESPQQEIERSPSMNSTRRHRLSSVSLPILAASRILSLKKKQPNNVSSEGLGIQFDSAMDEDSRNDVSNNYVDGLTIFKAANSPLVNSQRRKSLTKIEEKQPLLQYQDDSHDHDASENLAIAYGISTSAMNLSLTLVPLISAAIQFRFRSNHNFDPNKGTVTTPEEFVYLESFFAFECFVAALFSSIIIFIDYKYLKGFLLEKIRIK